MRSAGVCSYLVLSGLPEASGRWVCRNFRSELEAPLLRLSLPGCRLSPRCFMRALHSDRWHAADLDACAGRSGGSAGLPTCFAVLPWTRRAQSSARASGARLAGSGALSARRQLSGVPPCTPCRHDSLALQTPSPHRRRALFWAPPPCTAPLGRKLG